jgi:hypothetical protein
MNGIERTKEKRTIAWREQKKVEQRHNFHFLVQYILWIVE